MGWWCLVSLQCVSAPPQCLGRLGKLQLPKGSSGPCVSDARPEGEGTLADAMTVVAKEAAAEGWGCSVRTGSGEGENLHTWVLGIHVGRRWLEGEGWGARGVERSEIKGAGAAPTEHGVPLSS